MTKLLQEDRLSVVLAVLRNAPTGASFFAIGVSLNPLPAKRNLQRWLTHLLTQKQVLRVGFGHAACDRLRYPVSWDVLGGDISVAAAVRQRVTLPVPDCAMPLRSGPTAGQQPRGALTDAEIATCLA